ncbi:hypothetical protein ACC668_10500 [Rhizobium ruizarguesonis]
MKLAVEYRNRTGIDPGKMTFPQIRFAVGVMREQDRLRKQEMAESVLAAISAAFGNKEAFTSL